MEELKPCPFCGRSADISEKFIPDLDGELYPAYFPHCVICDANMNSEFETEQEAIKAWNRRV